MAVAGRDVPPVLLFYHPSMKKLADEVLKIVQQPNRVCQCVCIHLSCVYRSKLILSCMLCVTEW